MKKIKAWVNGEDFCSDVMNEQEVKDVLRFVAEESEAFACFNTASIIQQWVRCKDVSRIEVIEVGEEEEIKVGGTE